MWWENGEGGTHRGKKSTELFSMSLVLQFIKLSLSRQDVVGDCAGWAGTEQPWKEGQPSTAEVGLAHLSPQENF